MSIQTGSAVVLDDVNNLQSIVDEVEKLGINGLQFSINPSSLTPIKPLKTAIKRHLYLVLHGKYLYNFCRKNVENQLEILTQEVNLAAQLSCDVVIHQGKNVESEKMTKLEAINNYVKNISDVIERTFDVSSSLLLENSAGQGNELGSSVDELAYIYHQFDDNIKERIGFCIDTCHIFVAGELDVRKASAVTDFFSKFDQLIGLDKLKCIHFNDSGAPFESHRDFHGDIMGGYISNALLGGSPEGLQQFAKLAHKNHIPMIFETPCSLMEHIADQNVIQHQIVKCWINDLPMPEQVSQIGILSAQMYAAKPKKRLTKKKA